MMRKSLHILPAIFCYLFILIYDSLYAQPVLKPFIGVSSLPDDYDSICPIPLSIDTSYLYNTVGLQQGDTIPDFKLYTTSEDSMHVIDALSSAKPILLVGGSYTCPKFRNHLDQLNDLQAAYGAQINIYIVYTVEAHPAAPDISPYKGAEWELNSNIIDGIVYPQAVTYLDRKNAAGDMLNDLQIDVPVLLDGACNEWWQAFALAPNPAILIDPNGIVVKKQAWFDNGMYSMSNAIDSLLGQIATNVEAIDETVPFVKVNNDPSQATVKFIFAEIQSDIQLSFFDAGGRIVKSLSESFSNALIVSKEQLSTGIYFYSLQTQATIATGKVLIK